MNTPIINFKNPVEQVNQTSIMDADGPSGLDKISSESNGHQSESASDKPGVSSLSGNSNCISVDESEQFTSPSCRILTDSDDLKNEISRDGRDGVNLPKDTAAVDDNVSSLDEVATAVDDTPSPVDVGVSSLNVGATALDPRTTADTDDTSVTKRAEPIKSHGANPVLLSQLLEMGVPANLAIRALLFSGNSSVEGAFTWLAELSAEEADALSIRPVEDDAHDWEDVDDDDEGDTFSHKMALVVDTSLRMKPGKTAAQVGHAVLGLYRVLQRVGARQRASALSKWEMTGEKMVVLRANDNNQLRLLKRKADAVRLSSYMVADAGLTQIAPGSVTVLAIFGTSREVDLVTGDLKLL